MPFCVKCGAKVTDKAKFCHKCGTPVTYSVVKKEDFRQQELSCETNKCKYCGGEIPSFTAICPYCGSEVFGAKISASLDSFIKQINYCEIQIANSSTAHQKGWSNWGIWKKIGWVILNIYLLCFPLFINWLLSLLKTNKDQKLSPEEMQKVVIIENSFFPNDRSFILDGLLFIKSKVFLLTCEKFSANIVYWMRLWTKKADDLYAKAELLFPGDTIAKRTITEIHNNYKKACKKQKNR